MLYWHTFAFDVLVPVVKRRPGTGDYITNRLNCSVSATLSIPGQLTVHPTSSPLLSLNETMIALRSVRVFPTNRISSYARVCSGPTLSQDPSTTQCSDTNTLHVALSRAGPFFSFKSQWSKMSPPWVAAPSPLSKSAPSYSLHYSSLHKASENFPQFGTLFLFLCTCLLSLLPSNYEQRAGSTPVSFIIVCFIHDYYYCMCI